MDAAVPSSAAIHDGPVGRFEGAHGASVRPSLEPLRAGSCAGRGSAAHGAGRGAILPGSTEQPRRSSRMDVTESSSPVAVGGARQTAMSPEDAALLAALRGGDEDAFTRLVEPLPRLLDPDRHGLRPGSRRGRGGRPGDVDRRGEGARPLRGPFEPGDVDLPDRHLPGAQPRSARAAHDPALRPRSRAGRAVRRPGSVPRARRPVGGRLEVAARELGARRVGAPPRARDHAGDRGLDAASCPSRSAP